MKKKELIINIGAKTRDLENALSRSGDKLGKFVIAASAVGVAAGVTFKTLLDSVKEFREFEKGFSNVVTLLDDSSFAAKSLNEGIADLRKGVIDLRASTGRSFEDLNKSLFDLVSAGVDAASAVDTLKVSTDLALAGATETGIAVDGMTSAMNAYGYEADQAQTIAEKFFTAQKFGKTTIQELATDFGKVAATASEMGVSFDEVLASVSSVTLAGVKTNEAYTGLKAVLSNIIKPSKDAADEAERLGINFDSTALRARGLQGFLETITTSADFNSRSLERLFGSMEAVNVVMALTGSQAASFNDILSELNNEASRGDTFQNALAEKNNTVDESFKRLQGSASALLTTIGQELSPAFTKFANSAAEGLDILRLSITDTDEALARLGKSLDSAIVDYYKFALKITNLDVSDPFSKVDPGASLKESVGNPFNEVDPSASLKAIEKKNELEKKLADEKKAREEEEAALAAKLAKEKAEREAEIQQRKEERAEEARQRKLEREEEQFDEDVELLFERLGELDRIESEFTGLRELRELQELKKKAKTADQKQKIDKATALAAEKYAKHQALAATASLEEILGTSTAVGKAIFLFNKAMAIADTIKTTQQAAMLAYASQLIPGDPTSIARAEAARALTYVRGAVSVAAITATAIEGMQEGGIVPGTGSGDKVLRMLEPQEIVVPKAKGKTFEQLFGNFPDQNAIRTLQGGGVEGREISVMIGLTDDASQILTATQYEDRQIGIAR